MIVEIILITILTVFSSSICTIAGFGTTTISLTILSLFFPIHQTILFIAMIHWIENIWRLILFKPGLRWKIILQFGIPAIFASALGARISINIQEEILSVILGIFLLSYAIFILLKPRFILPQKITTSITGGALSGFFAGIIGLGGAIRSAFLHAYNLPKITYIFSANAISFMIDTTRLPIYFMNGTSLKTSFVWTFILFIPLSLAGIYYAKKIVFKIPENYFRIIITIFLALAGLKFILCNYF